MTLNQIDMLEKELERLLAWIGAAESRLAFIFSLATAMLGSIAFLIPDLAKSSRPYMATTALLALLMLVASISFAALATFPRTKGKGQSLVYFGSISSLRFDEYAKSALSLTEEEYVNDLIAQCHRNARIAAAKFAWIKWSMRCVFLASLPWSLSIYAASSG